MHFCFFMESLVLQFEIPSITAVACPVGEGGFELVPSSLPDGSVHRVCTRKRRVSSGTNSCRLIILTLTNQPSNGHNSFILLKWRRSDNEHTLKAWWIPACQKPLWTCYLSGTQISEIRLSETSAMETTQQSVYRILITIPSLFRSTFREPYILLNLSIGRLRRRML